MEWIAIPGGTFRMGSDSGFPEEKPVHEVRVPAFRMTKTEVTVAQYRPCVTAGACTAPETGGSCNWGRPDREGHPVNCVTWDQARTFARWAGGRLPSEAEWEYAARSGGLAREFPWGNEMATCEQAVLKDGNEVNLAGCGRRATWPVCSKPLGTTIQGLCDMAGNVAEWVEDVYARSYEGAPRDGSARHAGGSTRVLRGGGWGLTDRFQRVAFRLSLTPSDAGDYAGFRCAR